MSKRLGRDQHTDVHSSPGQEENALDIVALDDDADFREYISDTLASIGHRVRIASTAQNCYELIAESQPDILLLDMNMGRETGEQVLDTVRQRWAKLCVIVITGYPSLEAMRETFKRDVYDYITKPFSIDDLAAVLKQASSELGLGGTPQHRLRQDLGRQIRLARTEHGWTLKDLSESSGVSVSQLSSVERGAHLPSMESLLVIARALEARPSDWLRDAGF